MFRMPIVLPVYLFLGCRNHCETWNVLFWHPIKRESVSRTLRAGSSGRGGWRAAYVRAQFLVAHIRYFL